MEKDPEKSSAEEKNPGELIDVGKSFLSEEPNDFVKHVKKYLYDEVSYANRVNTFSVWVNKPPHLCSLILARNGFVCQNQNVIKCEICGCKYVYKMGTYSIYTKINNLSLLHKDNCPWKKHIMNLSFFKLDKISLTRSEILKEYEKNTIILKNVLNKIPLINIKGIIRDLILIIKKHLRNDKSKENFLIFNSQVQFFKKHFVEIFLYNDDVIQNGIHFVKKNFKQLQNSIVDLKYIENLHFDISDFKNYINILSGVDSSELLSNHFREDINMYLKIVCKMRDYDYLNVCIFKAISLFGWTCKENSNDLDSSRYTIVCKYCCREVNICHYSHFDRNTKEMVLFKDVNPSHEKEVCAHLTNRDRSRSIGEGNSKGVDAVQRLIDLVTGQGNKVEKGESEKGEVEKGESEKGEVEKGEVEKDEVEKDEVEKDEVEKDESEKGESKKDEVEKDESKKDESKKDESKKDESKKDEAQKDESKKDESKKDESKKDESEKDESKKDEAQKDESQKDEVKYDQESGNKEGLAFRWKLKNLFLSKKNFDNIKDGKDWKDGKDGKDGKDEKDGKDGKDGKDEKDGNSTPRENSLDDSPVSKKETNLTEKKLYMNKTFEEKSLSKTFLDICTHVENEPYFLKTVYDYYVLEDSHMAHSSEKDTNEEKDKKLYAIRSFNTVENHRLYCPYMMEDLYSFSKITKLFFELLMSDFQRKYMFK
ncbi:zinc finger protein, putative [Plasmodium ovale wallikeri]|uniref:Zinc finger protein, putative n=1 Tax=Plasmodium ovale wallikeri TaxID=864142 RepID=A0A1A8YYD2_PLAOA|nr:zinc finger protein, putative [Plasmodium ovale wallikeri]